MKTLSVMLASAVLLGSVSFASPVVKQDTKAPVAKQAAKPTATVAKPAGKPTVKPGTKPTTPPVKGTKGHGKDINKRTPPKKMPAAK
jgi:hypothetical protein